LSDDWVVVLTPSARRDIRRLDRQVSRRVEQALDQLAANPASAHLRKLKGRNESRLRVGDWRVLLELDHQAHAVVVHHVLPRGCAYRT
jgi:mRNA-degrading endonuclease RelE of RelBE toxin-antitoxin system